MATIHRRIGVVGLAWSAIVLGVLASEAASGDPQDLPPLPPGFGVGPRTAPRAGAAAPAANRAVATAVFRKACLNCHDNDGKGEIGRDLFPKVPDFTDPAWQDSRTDPELIRSLIEGKGKMPAMRAKLGPADARQIVAFVRGFRGGKQVVEDEPESAPASGGAARPRPAAAAAATARPGLGEAAPLFRRLCAACHDTDGRGSSAKGNFPTIPDFTVRTWQAARKDPQLLVSILGGKGTGMPPFREKLTRDQARALVGHIRSFAPGAARPTVAAPDDFEERFRKLEDEMAAYRRQFRALVPSRP